MSTTPGQKRTLSSESERPTTRSGSTTGSITGSTKTTGSASATASESVTGSESTEESVSMVRAGVSLDGAVIVRSSPRESPRSPSTPSAGAGSETRKDHT